MTREQALEVMEDLQRLLTNYRHISPELTEANGFAIEALEKQVPIKPIYEPQALGRGFTVIICPRCQHQLDSAMAFPHCWFCGQRMDWSKK